MTMKSARRLPSRAIASGSADIRQGARALCARLSRALVLVLAGLSVTAALADDQSLEQGARHAGRATGSAFHEIGQGAKKAGIEIGHAARDAGKKIGHGAAEAGRNIGRATSEGAKEFWHAIKGQS